MNMDALFCQYNNSLLSTLRHFLPPLHPHYPYDLTSDPPTCVTDPSIPHRLTVSDPPSLALQKPLFHSIIASTAHPLTQQAPTTISRPSPDPPSRYSTAAPIPQPSIKPSINNRIPTHLPDPTSDKEPPSIHQLTTRSLFAPLPSATATNKAPAPCTPPPASVTKALCPSLYKSSPSNPTAHPTSSYAGYSSTHICSSPPRVKKRYLI